MYTGFTDGVTGFTETVTGFTDPDKLSYDRSGPPQTSGNDVLSLDIDTAGLQLSNPSGVLKNIKNSWRNLSLKNIKKHIFDFSIFRKI